MLLIHRFKHTINIIQMVEVQRGRLHHLHRKDIHLHTCIPLSTVHVTKDKSVQVDRIDFSLQKQELTI